jgi:AraC-like DNA-binding protein
MPGGSAIAPHSHRWPQLIAAVSGVMTVWTEDGTWVAPPAWAVWAPAGFRHGIRFSGTVEMRTLFLNPDALQALPLQPAVIAVSPLLRELTLRAVELGMLDERHATHCALATLIAEALRTHDAPPFQLPMPRSPQLLALARAAIADTRSRSIAELAHDTGSSARTLERKFQAETGVALGQWIRQSRLIEALRDLAAGMSVKATAARAGYRTSSSFVAAFRAQFGESPGRYFSKASSA